MVFLVKGSEGRLGLLDHYKSEWAIANFSTILLVTTTLTVTAYIEYHCVYHPSRI